MVSDKFWFSADPGGMAGIDGLFDESTRRYSIAIWVVGREWQASYLRNGLLAKLY